MSKKNSPLVTGISPKEGPPGTRVTIRGENLGLDARDLVGLKICGVDCLLSAEWKSPSKITARTGPGKGVGDVVLSTRSGGGGTCSVGFRGYFVQTGPLQESSIWIDESCSFSSTSLLRSQPSSPVIRIEDDPLGISDETNPAKFPEEELLEFFPESSGNITLDNFNPVWFLVENHHNTKFTDLRDGLTFLKMRVAQRSDGPLSFCKANLTTFLDCQEALEAMHKQLLEDELRDQGCCLTEKLEYVIQQSNSCANSLFQDVLGRKDRADATRNALSVLNRFKFLFNLPWNIEKNIKKGDYDLVINDYARAKSLFGSTEVQVFKKVYAEVEQRISSLREMLQHKLMQLPSTLEEQKKIIRYLTNLQVLGDPAWECIVNQQKWLLSLLSSCKDEHLHSDNDNTVFTDYPMSPRMTPHISTPRGSYQSNLRQFSMNSSQSPDMSVVGSPGPSGPGSNSQQMRSPQKVQFVEDLTAVLTDTLPDLWKLGQAYFSGQLVLKDQPGAKASSPDGTKHAHFKKMITEIIDLFCNLLRAGFLPDTLTHLQSESRDKIGQWPEGDIPGAWLPHCVRHIRSCVVSVLGVDLHSECTELLQEVAFDMRIHCLKTLLRQAVDDVHSLHTRESWIVEVSDEYGGTTQLPLLFENVINETIQHLHEVVMKVQPGESEIFNPRPVQKEATLLCTQLLQAFAKCLQNLALHGTGEKQMPMMSLVKMNKTDHDMDGVPSLDRRLIIMLSNCNNTIERVIPRLLENLDKHGYPEINKVYNEASETYSALDKELFGAYIEEKTNPIIGVLEQNMYMGRFDWKNTPRPTGVRTYIKTLLTTMIAVHAEVFSISPAFVSRVLHQVVQSVADELSRLFQCVAAFSNYGALQARLDLQSLKETVDLYLHDDSRASFDEAMNCAQQITLSDDKRLFGELRNQFRARMKFHLLCLRQEPLPDYEQ